MRISKERIMYLLQVYSDRSASSVEEAELFNWLENATQNQEVEAHILQLLNMPENGATISDVDWEKLYSNVLTRAEIKKKPSPVKYITWFRVAVASLAFLFSAGLYLLVVENTKPVVTGKLRVAVLKNDVLPGKNGAILTLGSGRKILLDSLSDGMITGLENTNIKKQKEQISYDAPASRVDSVTYNTISTPAGRQYAVLLSDGSKVWLNASSSVTFPTMFTGTERKVAIMGEVYFEVVHNASAPFVVSMNENTKICVMGTHFNVNAYDNETVSRTTLLEGSIKISAGPSNFILTPGEQASLDGKGRIKIARDINTEEVIAWKNGIFQFEGATIDAVMRQLSRWYDVEVEYKGIISKHFGGTISRDVNLSQVLKMLELTGEVKFMIQGRKIIAMPI